MHTTDTAQADGVFQRLGDFVVRWPWLIIGLWIAVAAVLPLSFPSLTEMAEKHPVAILPADAPVTVTTNQMTEAFHESGSENILLVVLTNEKGLSPADEAVYRKLVDNLRADKRDVVMLQDFLTTPPLREFLTGKDQKAWTLPVGLAGELGSPESYASSKNVTNIAKDGVAGSSLTMNITGPAATVVDLTDIGALDRIRIELALTVMLLGILLVIYRHPVTMTLPLITIGVSLVVAQAAVSGVAQLGLGVSNQTIVLLSGMMAGAGTDYAVFLISRYHDYLRRGADSDQAVKKALTSIGKVIAASAATVAVTFMGMFFAKLGLFKTVGIALAIAVGVVFLAAVTLLPAIIAVAGRRGWLKPRRDLTTRFWRRSGIRIVRRPVAHLVASLIVLIILASCAMLVRYNYDDRKALPRWVDSSAGYAAVDRHFPVNSTIPQYLFVQSPHDLRTPEALADLEQMAQRVSQLPGIEAIRGITRPTGESLEQARTSWQAGEVGTKLDEGAKLIGSRSGDLDKLTGGAHTLADSLGTVRNQVTSAITTVRSLVDALFFLQNQFGGQKTLAEIDNAAKLVGGMRELGDAIGVNLANIADTFSWAGPVVTALNVSPVCDADPSCRNTRVQLQRLVAARDDGTLDKVADLARRLQQTQGAHTLESTAKNLDAALETATGALHSLGLDEPGGVSSRLAKLQADANLLADGSRQLADGVQLLVDQVKTMGAGLDEASAFLLAMKNEAASPPMAGFYIPPQIFSLDEFKKAAQIFFSPDGRAVRYLVQTKLNPFSTDAMDQVNAITDTARSAQPNTALSDASISMAGYPVMLRDTRDYYNHDIRLIIAITVIVVFLILVALLRAIVAPIYLIGSVVFSYLSALGIGVIMFQFILGQELHWSVPGLTFIVLVAVGADYNMLLISRIRDESPHGVRSGVIRTVGSTGGVITAAGLIFAASMFGLLFSSLTTVVQAGFVVGVGLLLDTFLVRTITVPAIAAMIGRANWWPSRLSGGPRALRVRTSKVSTEPALAGLAD
jgi:RND superfamily putative drug exporter